MAHIHPEDLDPVAQRLVAASSERLSRSEYAEILRLAQAMHCATVASATGISYETVRARRKRIYKKLRLTGANDVLSSLLRIALTMLTEAERSGVPTGARQPSSLADRGSVQAAALGGAELQ